MSAHSVCLNALGAQYPSGGAKTQRHLATAQGHQRGGHAEAGEHGLPDRRGMSLGDLDPFVDLVDRGRVAPPSKAFHSAAAASGGCRLWSAAPGSSGREAALRSEGGKARPEGAAWRCSMRVGSDGRVLKGPVKAIAGRGRARGCPP